MNASMLVRTMIIALPLASLSPVAHAGCFFMYDAKNALVYQSSTSPIDLSRPVSEQMARRFPSRALVIATTTSCSDDTTVAGPASRFIGTEDVRDPYASSTDGTRAPRTSQRTGNRR